MTLVTYIVKMILISAMLYGYYWFFLRNKSFHLYNRFYLLGIIITASVLPLLKIPMPFAGIVNTHPSALPLNVVWGDWEDPVTITARKNMFKTFLSWQYLGLMVYISGSIILLLALARPLLYISRISHAYACQQVDDITFFDTEEPGTPFSFFKKIFWNHKLDLQSVEGQQIFRHELYHVRQNHSADILFLEIFTVLTWFNPFIYFIKKEIKAIHEFLADEYAISGNNRYAYAELLITQSIRNKQAHVVNPFFHNQIKRRINMITKFKSPKNNYLSRLMILPVTLFLLCAFAGKVTHKNLLAPKTITVVIDAGHGGIDPGSTTANGIVEKDLTLKISKKIQELAKHYNVAVVMTREKDELPGNAATIQDGLKNRTDIATKNNAELFISIHINSDDKNPSATGIQMYISDKDQNLTQKNIKLGSLLSQELKKDYHVDEELVKSRRGIAVLNNSPIPAVIVELGYISNASDLAYFSDDNNQEKIAKDILEGIVRYHTTAGYNQVQGATESTAIMLPAAIHTDSIPKGAKIYKKVEIESEYPGGQGAWQKFLSTNLHYPDAAVDKEIQGDVLLEFIVDKEGNVSDVKAISGPDELKSESVRVLVASGKWTPAMNHGKKVICYKRQPIKYRLEKQ